MNTQEKTDTVDVREFAVEFAVKDAREVAQMRVGDWVRQGDVYLEMVDGLRGWAETTDRQLAPGTSQGSRHIVVGEVRIFTCPNPDSLVRGRIAGPQVQSDGPFRVSHPEHADMELPPGCFQVWYQSDPRTMARVLD